MFLRMRRNLTMAQTEEYEILQWNPAGLTGKYYPAKMAGFFLRLTVSRYLYRIMDRVVKVMI